jgi:hypothetical protein
LAVAIALIKTVVVKTKGKGGLEKEKINADCNC